MSTAALLLSTHHSLLTLCSSLFVQLLQLIDLGPRDSLALAGGQGLLDLAREAVAERAVDRFDVVDHFVNAFHQTVDHGANRFSGTYQSTNSKSIIAKPFGRAVCRPNSSGTMRGRSRAAIPCRKRQGLEIEPAS